VRLERGTGVTLAFPTNGSSYEIPAQVIHSGRGRIHLLFPRLTIAQEKYLVNLVYSRPEAWIAWNNARLNDSPLRSLAHIALLGVRGIGLVMLGLFTRRPAPDRVTLEERKRERAPAVAASLLLCGLLLGLPARGIASDPPEPTTATPSTPAGSPVQSQPAAFHDQYLLAELSGQKLMTLSGAGASQNLFLDMPLTKIISRATLDLFYAAPWLNPGESWLELWLNGTRVGSLPLQPGSDQQVSVPLPTDLLTNNNTLTFQIQGACAACARKSASWVTINPRSQLSLSGTKLPLANDLALLPIPFFDPAGQHSWSLPIVFSDRPSTDELKAASIVASWFGIFSDFRGVRFPVEIGNLPEGNAVVFTLRDSKLAASLPLPSHPGAQIVIRDNPRDPYGKLLIIAGAQPEDLVSAARALVTRNNAQAHTDAAYVSASTMPARREYDAPRWLNSDHPAAIGTYTTEERLKVKGSGSVNLYFRIPPDLFLQSQQSVPLLLKFGYAGVAEGSRAALHVRLNDRDVDSIRLDPASSSAERAEIVRLPTGRMRPYTNTLTLDVDFGRGTPPSNVWRYAAIHRDSTIDLSSLPHSVVLPRLELFADSGFPFTAWPDLGRTAIVLSGAPTSAEYEILLGMAGFFGAQTGSPATAITITDPSHIQTISDKDLILLGRPASQPLFSEWADSMPLEFSSEGMRPNDRELPSRWLHPEWPFRNADREKLMRLMTRTQSFDVALMGFVSPLRPDRSVVSVVPLGPSSLDAIAAMFTPAAEKGPIYGGLSLAQNSRFQSFLVGTFAYHSGHLDPVQQSRIFLFENYFLIPFFVALLALLVAVWVRQSTERIAARRLVVGRT
jgi:cellulose synthase (UDP-forming)